MRPSGEMGGEEREEKRGKGVKNECKIMLTTEGENGKKRLGKKGTGGGIGGQALKYKEAKGRMWGNEFDKRVVRVK